MAAADTCSVLASADQDNHIAVAAYKAAGKVVALAVALAVAWVVVEVAA